MVLSCYNFESLYLPPERRGMAKSQPTAPVLERKIRKCLNKLEKLSPREIKNKIAGHRSGFNQNTELVARWLCEELDLPRVVVKTSQNAIQNLEVIVELGSYSYVFNYYVQTSLQEFLGIKKNNNAVPGVTLTDNQAILVRAIIDREGGSEADFLRELLDSAFANSAVVADFVNRLKDHPEWHSSMHSAGLYPADIFAAAKAVRKSAK